MAELTGTHTPDGKCVVLVWQDKETKPVHIPVAANETGLLAMALLGHSIKCAEITGKRSELASPESAAQMPRYVVAHAVGIGDAQERPDLFVLSFAIGATEVCIGIKKEHLAALGRSLLTESADERATPN